jgi:hypothetical protein
MLHETARAVQSDADVEAWSFTTTFLIRFNSVVLGT